MDWPLAITRNQDALKRIVAALFAMLTLASRSPLYVGFADTAPHKWGEVKSAEIEPSAAPLTSPRERGEGSRAKPVTERGLRADASAFAFTLPRHLYAAILLILRPAESAVRRLILIAAHGLSLKPRAPRPVPAGLASFGEASASKIPSFCLFDPLKHFDLEDYDNNALPRFSFDSSYDPEFQAPHGSDADEPVNAVLLFARLRALRHALSDIPRQARRLARWQARRDLFLKSKVPFKPMRMSIFRPGLPPGWRQRSIHAVDDVLRECHGLARDLVNGPETG